MNILEIRHLRMLQKISGTGNMTRAAETLFITQSALSQQLKDLENKIGTELFLRTGKKMILTRVGKELLRRGENIISQIEDAELDIARMVNGEKGEIKIGVRCFFCYKWLPEVLGQFQDRFPNVDISIGNSVDPEKDLISEKIDISISAPPATGDKIESRDLFEGNIYVAMSENHPKCSKKFMELSDFHNSDIIAMVEKSKHSFFRHFMNNKKIKPRRYMIISHPEAMMDLISAGLGMGILPGWFVKPHLEDKKLVISKLTAKGSILVWKACWLKSKQLPVYQEEFIKIMKSKVIV